MGSLKSPSSYSKLVSNVQAGNAFILQHGNSSLASGSAINVYFKTPTTGYIYALFNHLASGNFDIDVLEAPTITSNTGTNAVVPFNRNRASLRTIGILDNATTPASNRYARDVTITGTGTTIVSKILGLRTAAGAGADTLDQLVLKQDTGYVFRLTSRASANRVQWNITLYSQ